jgi:hypothetical protein
LLAHALSTRSRVLGASRSPTDDVHEAWVCDVGRLHPLSGRSRRTSGERPGGHHDGECVAMSDVLALGAIQAAAELGIRVPTALSVVGFDDSPAASLATPALTTVAQPHDEKGRLAAEWLVRALERGRTARGRRRRAILPTELVIRESTAPPKKR